MKTKVLILLLLTTTVFAEQKLSPLQLSEKIVAFEHSKIIWQESSTPLQKLKHAFEIEDAVHREWSLAQSLKTISVDHLSDGVRLWLQQLLTYKSKTKSWLDDGGHKIEITPWPVAAQARSILTRWKIVQSKNIALKNLSESNWSALFQSTNKNQQFGNLQAIMESTSEHLVTLGQKIYDEGTPTNYQLQLLWAISKKPQKTLWMKRVIRLANATFSTQLMKQNLATSKQANEKDIELLIEAIQNPNMQSYALLKLGSYADQNNNVSSLLLSYLKHKKLGGSAARALSKSNSIHIQQQLQRLSQNDDVLLRTRAQQALKWQQQFQQQGL